MARSDRLRELATWYREIADKAGAPTIWELRLMTAEDLEREADAIDRKQPSEGGAIGPPAARRN